MIELSRVYKSFDAGKTYSVDNVSFEIATGETLVILGSSGSGKTTILKMINRLIDPTSGHIIVDNKDNTDIDLVKLRQYFGYVFQGVGLFPHMTVAENITVVLRLEKVSKTIRAERARELLRFVNLDPNQYANRLPEELSGGQKQRVGVARALATEPTYLLMDEPFGALDSITRDALQYELVRLKKTLQKTIIFVTHDVFEALRIADRIAIMDKGKLLQIGTKKEILSQPANQFVHELFAKPAKQIAAYAEVLKISELLE